MRFLRGIFTVILLVSGFGAIGQTKEQEKQPRILILLDGSSSMGSKWTPQEDRFKAASRIITTLIDSLYKVNKDVEFALRVYGHQSPAQYNNCYDSKLEVMFSKDNLTQMTLRLAALKAVGVSPIAFSLKEAAENDMPDLDRNTYSLILITDGEESCGGNICDVVAKLLQKKIDFKPYILSLVDNTALKSQYDCLGNYLLVGAEKDVKPVVGKIVEAYRPMLTMTPAERRALASTVINAPSALKVNIPKFEVKREVEVKEEPIVTPSPPPPLPKPKPKIETPPIVQPEVKPATPTLDLTDRTNENIRPDLKIETIQPLRPVTGLMNFRAYYVATSFRQIAIPKYDPPALRVDIPTQEAPSQLAAGKPNKVSTPSQAPVVAASVKIPKVEVKPLITDTITVTLVPDLLIPARSNTVAVAPPATANARAVTVPKPLNKTLKADTIITAPSVVQSKPAVTPGNKPAVTSVPGTAPSVVKKPAERVIEPVEITKPKELKFTQKTEEAKETTFQVYFTDGKSTYYQTTPQLVLLDPKTRKPLHKFYRTVDAAGTPDKQKVPAGLYSLTITGKANYIVPDIKIDPDKNTAITIPVTEGSLYFAYANNRSRPVEYTATVFRRFSSAPVVRQKCTQELFYEPGTYHVEVNTLPPFKRTFDLNFGEQYEIQLPEEGDLVITDGISGIGKVNLFYPFGDQFRIFYSFNLNEKADGMKLRLLPGTYKVGYKKTPDSEQTVVEFVITSNNLTILQLK